MRRLNMAIPDYEAIKNVIVWRCLSSRFFSGGMTGFSRTEYVYDDYVLTTGMGRYFEEIAERNVNKITITRVGPFSNVLGSTMKHRAGTTSIAKEKLNTKLEMFM